jgi:D-aminopeptidase
MRVLVSVDMEGIAGVVDAEDVRPGHSEYERNRTQITAEASAAVRGVYASDPAAEVLVSEAHAGFRNLLPDQLDRRGVPPVLVAGDDTVAAEAAETVPGMHAVVVKRALGGRAAALLHPQEACERIEQAVPKALADRDAVRPPRFDGPVELEVEVLSPHQTERALLIPGVQRPGGRTLRYTAPDFPVAYQVIQLIAMLGGL